MPRSWMRVHGPRRVSGGRAEPRLWMVGQGGGSLSQPCLPLDTSRGPHPLRNGEWRFQSSVSSPGTERPLPPPSCAELEMPLP